MSQQLIGVINKTIYKFPYETISIEILWIML